jgi:hypothetical protein
MESLLCSYRNATNELLLLRCCGPDQFFFEKLLFPFELFGFHCPPSSDLEVWHHSPAGSELVERLQAEELASEPSPSASELPGELPLERRLLPQRAPAAPTPRRPSVVSA